MQLKDPGAAGVELTVKDGEWVGSLAVTYGHFMWETSVWRHPRNECLRAKRRDPHLLSAGDKLFIPPRGKREDPCACDMKHTFKLRRTPEFLRLRLLDSSGQPRVDVQYELKVEFSDSAEKFRQQGTKSDAEGMIEERIPCSSTRGVLKLQPEGEEIELRLGRLEPVDPDQPTLRRKAAQQRLSSLGFYNGEVDGAESPALTASVKAFQQFCRDRAADGGSAPDAGEPDGQLTPQTLGALQEYYGC